MRGSFTRVVAALTLGAILVGAIVGIAIDLSNAQSRGRADVERSARERASLAAALIDSIFASSNSSAAADGPISQRLVTPAEIRSVVKDVPLATVIDAHHGILGSSRRQSNSVLALMTGNPATRAALAGAPIAVSNLLPRQAGLPLGFVAASPFRTRYGKRVVVAWYPFGYLAPIFRPYLSEVGHYRGAQVYLADAHGFVLSASDSSAGLGRPIPDSRLRSLLARGSRTGTYADGSSFYAESQLHTATWSVVYKVPTQALYTSTGSDGWVSFLLLTGFAIAAGVCLLLLVRLASRSGELSRANAVLAQRNQEVVQADLAKTRFLANMSHELRTPLNAIIGFSELMGDERLGSVSEERSEYLGDIRSSAQHLLNLINDMLDLARIESGRIVLDVQEVDPVQIIADCVDSVRPMSGENHLALEFEADPIGPVLLDPGRLRQVLLNYLSNAIKFTPPYGRVGVRAWERDSELVIEVSDSGHGIGPADQERVFLEFEQLGQRPRGGTGLGLAVTKRIVEAQGGAVGVRSEPGHGATFYARLPLTRAPVADRAKSDEPTGPPVPARVGAARS